MKLRGGGSGRGGDDRSRDAEERNRPISALRQSASLFAAAAAVATACRRCTALSAADTVSSSPPQLYPLARARRLALAT